MVEFDFEGRVVLVTGGSSGIGRSVACAFARVGASVAICARGERAGADACEQILSEGGRARFFRVDVRDERSIADAVRETVRAFGRLDHAVNAAGIGGDMAPLERADQAVFDDVMQVNARGVWLSMRHEIPAMLESGGGAIVNVASVYGLAGKPAHHAYVASKHAVVGMTRSVALEYATRGIRVNALCAGATRTPAMIGAEAAVPELVASLVAAHPMARMATEEEIARPALFLCSEAAAFITGAPLPVDGGLLAA